MIQIQEIDCEDELRSLRHIWDDLVTRSGVNNVFSTWDWAVRWWGHFGSGKRLKVLVARENDEIIGLAPLVLSRYGFGAVRRIEFLGSPHSNYNEFILLRNESACVRAFLTHLTGRSDWGWLQLSDVREDTLSAKILLRSAWSGHWKLQSKTSALCYFMQLPNSVEDFHGMMGRRMRESVRRKMRKLREDYVVEIKTQRDFGSIENAMKVLFELHRKRWNDRGKAGAFAAPHVREFHTAIAKDFDRNGWLSMYFLTADDRPVACEYCFEYGGKVYAYQAGFDPLFAPSLSLGTLVQVAAIEESIRKRLKEFDFLKGAELYKLLWSTDARTNLNVQLFRNMIVEKAYSVVTENRTTLSLSMRASEHLSFLRGL